MLKILKNIRFDKVIKKKLNDKVFIEYGIIKGNNIVVLIKIGKTEALYGNDKRYLKLARILNEKYGYTVITSSNPFDGTNPLDNAFEVIEEYVSKKRFDDYKVYYMGYSSGARVGMCFGHLYHKIERMLLINGALHINLHKSKDGLKNVKDKKVYLVYGKKDSSFVYIELLNSILNENIKLEIVSEADHHFSNMSDEFMQLPVNYFS